MFKKINFLKNLISYGDSISNYAEQIQNRTKGFFNRSFQFRAETGNLDLHSATQPSNQKNSEFKKRSSLASSDSGLSPDTYKRNKN